MSDAREQQEVLIVTGMSGAGRSTVGNALEDLGWYVVDNLPPQMLRPLVDLAERAGDALPKIAAVVDVRGGTLFSEVQEARRGAPREHASRCASCSSTPPTRRSCAVSSRCGGRIRCRATARCSTASSPSARGWRSSASRATSSSTPPNSTSTSSRRPSPRSSPTPRRAGRAGDGDELRLQVRPAHRRRHGRRRALPAQPVLGARAAGADRPRRAGQRRTCSASRAPRSSSTPTPQRSSPCSPGYQRENKRHATIAIGCTGGKHRSVAIAEELAARLRGLPGVAVNVKHRDLGRE